MRVRYDVGGDGAPASTEVGRTATFCSRSRRGPQSGGSGIRRYSVLWSHEESMGYPRRESLGH